MSTTYNPITKTFGNLSVGNATTGAFSWNNASWAGTTAVTMTPNVLEVSGDAVFKGNIRVKGRDLTDWLEQVESRLAILQVNPDMEAEFDELKALGDAYREAERRFNEQKRVYEILKTTDE